MMAGIFFRRLLRHLAARRMRYAAMLLLCAVIVGITAVLVGSGVTVLEGRKQNAAFEQAEDGQFTILMPMKPVDYTKLQTDFSLTLEEHFSFDVSDTAGVTTRVFADRAQIGRLTLCDGRAPVSPDEVVLEQLYAAAVGAAVGDTVIIDRRELTVVGIGCIPDYVRPINQVTDISVDPLHFTYVIVMSDLYDAWLAESGAEETYTYAYVGSAQTDVTALREAVRQLDLDYIAYAATHSAFSAYVEEQLRLLQVDFTDTAALETTLSSMADKAVLFLEAEDNPRMGEDTTYAELYRDIGMVVGAFLLILLSFVFAVTLRQQVTAEAGIIGSLFALGVGRRTLWWYYLLPCAIAAFIGGSLGLLLAYSPTCMEIALDAFHITDSIPFYPAACPWYVWSYALLIPPLISIAVNGASLYSLFRQSVLSVIRTPETGTPHRMPSTARLPAKLRIRIRFFRRNLPGMTVLFVGTLLSATLLFLGLNSQALTSAALDACADVPYEYSYALRYPMQTGSDADGERLLRTDCTYTIFGEKISVTLIGAASDSRYYPETALLSDHAAALGEAFASKSGLHVGDSLCLQRQNETYTFTVEAIIPTGPEMTVLTNLSDMQAMLGEPTWSYNTVVSDSVLSVPTSQLTSVCDRQTLVDSVTAVMKTMVPFIRMSVIAAALLFITLVYLSMQTMMTRQVRSMTLFRAFGYTEAEISNLFFTGLWRYVFLSAAVALPLGKWLANVVCPHLYAEMAIGMDFTLPPKTVLLVILTVAVLLCAIVHVIKQRVKKIPFSVLISDENTVL